MSPENLGCPQGCPQNPLPPPPAGAVPFNHEILREACALCHCLPVLSTDKFKTDFYDVSGDPKRGWGDPKRAGGAPKGDRGKPKVGWGHCAGWWWWQPHKRGWLYPRGLGGPIRS